MTLMGWMTAGIAPKLLKSLELLHKNKVPRMKDAHMSDPQNDVEREERLGTVWMTYILDSGFAVCSSWSGSIEYEEMLCNLPASNEDFRGIVSDL